MVSGPTDPFLPCPGWPNARTPFRAEFLLSDDGWWTEPNDLLGDGNRFTKDKGHTTQRLVDVLHGGLANAECQVELVEMAGYENPFVADIYAFDAMRKIKGDTTSPLCTNNYIQRRLMGGVVRMKWNKDLSIFSRIPGSLDGDLCFQQIQRLCRAAGRQTADPHVPQEPQSLLPSRDGRA